MANLDELGPESDQQPIETGSLKIDLFQRSVIRDGEEVHLTPKEYAVLAELAKHPGRVLSHAHLLRAAWGPAQESRPNICGSRCARSARSSSAIPRTPMMIINDPASAIACSPPERRASAL